MIAVIVEDEIYYVRQLKEVLDQWAAQNIPMSVYSFSSGEKMLTWYQKTSPSPDIVFLDIKLAGGDDGLAIAQKLRDMGYEKSLAFTTNYRDYHYASKGYLVNALRYLEKPVRYSDIEECFSTIDDISAFHYYYKREHGTIPCEEIIYLESLDHYIFIHKTNGTEIKYKGTLGEAADQLPKTFVQCHRSFIVNVMQISRIKEKHLYLKNGTELKIGKNYLSSVFSSFKKYT